MRPKGVSIVRRRRSTNVWCPDDIGRDSWVRGEQETLYIENSPHKVGEEARAEGWHLTGWDRIGPI